MGKKTLTPRYPENISVKSQVVKQGLSQTKIAAELGLSREIVSMTLNGHHKGVNIIPRIKDLLK